MKKSLAGKSERDRKPAFFYHKNHKNTSKIKLFGDGGCGFLCQRYNLKAIHNSVEKEEDLVIAVVSYVKDTIWKQFTTKIRKYWKRYWLWFPMSKIQSESNSQPRESWGKICFSCGFLCQRYNLKAIHNTKDGRATYIRAVVSYVKDTIWKQFTTQICTNLTSPELWFPMSKIQSESNSQQPEPSVFTYQRCGFLCQRYNLKAIHNENTRRIRNRAAVVSYVKDTIWKQFTTIVKANIKDQQLWFPMSKIQSESNSQQDLTIPFLTRAVVSYVKDTIWKQFTTNWICLF